MENLSPYIYKLCHARCFGYNVETSSNVATEMIKGGNALIIELGDYIDLEAEKKKMEDEIKKLENEIKRCESMLSNPNFVSKAPAQKVEQEKQKLDSQIELLRSQATELTYEVAMKKVGLLEHIFTILSREINTDRLHELEINDVN